MRNTRVAGHALRKEGNPYYVALCTDCVRVARDRGTWADENGLRFTGGQEGHGLCSCGALSQHMISTRARRAWHAEHKTAARQKGR